MPTRWVLTAGQTTSMVCTREFREIILTEDEELLAMASYILRAPWIAPLKLICSLPRLEDWTGESIPLVARMIQRESRIKIGIG
jgi:hypothetical protein